METMSGLLSMIGLTALLVSFFIWATKQGVSAGVTHANQRRQRDRDRPPEWSYQPPDEDDTGPKRYKVTGVDRETKMETTEYILAESEANARVKAELDGVVVTGVAAE